MKMLLAALFVVSATVQAAEMNYTVDTDKTIVTWTGKKVTGQHTGHVKAKSGSLTVNDGVVTKGDVVVDMKTITSTDITDKETNAKFIGHITTADFFDVNKYPESKLVITGSKKNAKGLEVTGNFTMMGKTNPITFQATEVSATDSMFSANADLKLDRTKWGLQYGSSSFIKGLGDKAIDNEFMVNVKLIGKK
jgi:polyisoprenoid-binding protein YceI